MTTSVSDLYSKLTRPLAGLFILKFAWLGLGIENFRIYILIIWIKNVSYANRSYFASAIKPLATSYSLTGFSLIQINE